MDPNLEEEDEELWDMDFDEKVDFFGDDQGMDWMDPNEEEQDIIDEPNVHDDQVIIDPVVGHYSSSDEEEVPLGTSLLHQIWDRIEKQPVQFVGEVQLHPEFGHGLGEFGPKTMWKEWEGNIVDEGIQTQPDGQPPLTPTQLNSLNSEVIRNVEMIGKIGKGNWAKVYKVKAEYKQTYSGSTVWLQGEFACKVIHPESNARVDIEKSMRDMLVLRYLRHDNICNMVDYMPIPDSVSGFPVSMVCLLLELGNGDLDDLLHLGRKQAGYSPFVLFQPYRFSERLNKHWLRDIVKGLVYLHSQGVAHADIKEGNILYCLGTTQSVPKQQQQDLGQNNEFDRLVLSSSFKLADFGIAKAPWLGKNEADEIQERQRNDIFKLSMVIHNCGVYGNQFEFSEYCRTGLLSGDDPNDWRDLSQEFKQLMARMTEIPSTITAQQILDEDWVRNQ